MTATTPHREDPRPARDTLKALARGAASVAILPHLFTFRLRSLIVGADRALMGSTQGLSLIPGLAGQYLRRAFLARVLDACHASAVVEFGTTFAAVGTRLEENVYIGPACHIGLVHVERDVLIAAGVHIPSGPRVHGLDDRAQPVRDQPGTHMVIRIGAGAWIGSTSVVMADVGANTIVGAGAVVTHALPAGVVAAGVPARVLRQR